MRLQLSTLLAVSTVSHVVALTITPRAIPHVGLHSEYLVKGGENRIQLWFPDYEDDVQTFEISNNFTPSVHYERLDRALLERDICAKITDCAGNAASSVAAWAGIAAQATVSSCNAAAGAVNDYLTNDNYGAVRNIFLGVVLGFAINIGSTVPQYFINAKLEARYGNSNNANDACGEKVPSVFANNAANAVYEFCVSIQGEVQAAATTNFDVLDMASSSSNGGGGFEGRAKMFISEQAATWGHICSNDYGVDWKFKLRRWVKSLVRA